MISKPRRIATLAVWRGNRELLMGLRQDNLKWTTPGGHLDDAESPVAGALRELQEETGIVATADELSYLGSVQTKSFKTGDPLEVHMFQLDALGRSPRTEYDPDQEVHGWSWASVSNGLPAGLAEKLHTPKNFLLRALGLMDFADEQTKLAAGSKHVAPMTVRREAAEGLRTLAMAGVKCDEQALKRARNLVEGHPLSAKDIHDTAAYFALYGNSVGENDVQGKPTRNAVEAALWGGGAAAKWATAMSATLKSGSFRLSASRLGRLFASAGSLEQIKKLIGEFYVSKNIQLRDNGDGTWDVHNANGKVDGVQVILKSGRYRFEATGSSLSEDTTEKKEGRPMHEVSADIKSAGVEDEAEETPEPPTPKKKTDAEMKEDPAKDTDPDEDGDTEDRE